ncbi:hypothetical protein BH10PLA1_BH10PLA1_16390 [soil metagenome]
MTLQGDGNLMGNLPFAICNLRSNSKRPFADRKLKIANRKSASFQGKPLHFHPAILA